MLEAVEEVFRSQVPALHRLCVFCDSPFQGEAGGQDAQSDPLPEEQKSTL